MLNCNLLSRDSYFIKFRESKLTFFSIFFYSGPLKMKVHLSYLRRKAFCCCWFELSLFFNRSCYGFWFSIHSRNRTYRLHPRNTASDASLACISRELHFFNLRLLCTFMKVTVFCIRVRHMVSYRKLATVNLGDKIGTIDD